jgi:fructuronate reductase
VDEARIIGALANVTDAADLDALARELAAPATRLVTLTITEAGYAGPAPSRLLHGLDARRRADAGPIAIVPCDNLPANGRLLRTLLHELADDDLSGWLDESVSFVSTSVDRITPATTPADNIVAEGLTGWEDAAPVVAEPFHNWVLSGEFPGGRPTWERAGAEFVDDIEPFERRKLWLLNAAHSALAYLGLHRGHRTVAEAIDDDVCRAAVIALWEEAGRHLPGIDVTTYCAQLLARWENHRIEHQLSQIALDGAEKLRVRVVPVALLELAAGRDAAACAAVVAAWQSHTGGTLRELSPELADTYDFVEAVRERTPA